jgi:hypothetical protein
MARYRTWGLDTDRGVGWWTRALCRGRTAMYFTRDHYIAAQAAHLCTHCPVLQSCRREAEQLSSPPSVRCRPASGTAKATPQPAGRANANPSTWAAGRGAPT